MQSWFGSFLSYLYLVFSNWLGIIGGVLTLYEVFTRLFPEKYKNRLQLPSKVIRPLAIGAILLSQFLVYHDLEVRSSNKIAKADLHFYCGQKDITGVGREIESLWIPSSNVAVPAVWVVNVGEGDAVNVIGRTDVKENLPGLPMTGDKEYPHSVSWSIPLLHPNDPQIIWGPSSWTPERLAKVSVKMQGRYNGPTAVAEFVVRFKPIPGPSYPPGYLPCPRPKKD